MNLKLLLFAASLASGSSGCAASLFCRDPDKADDYPELLASLRTIADGHQVDSENLHRGFEYPRVLLRFRVGGIAYRVLLRNSVEGSSMPGYGSSNSSQYFYFLQAPVSGYATGYRPYSYLNNAGEPPSDTVPFTWDPMDERVSTGNFRFERSQYSEGQFRAAVAGLTDAQINDISYQEPLAIPRAYFLSPTDETADDVREAEEAVARLTEGEPGFICRGGMLAEEPLAPARVQKELASLLGWKRIVDATRGAPAPVPPPFKRPYAGGPKKNRTALNELTTFALSHPRDRPPWGELQDFAAVPSAWVSLHHPAESLATLESTESGARFRISFQPGFDLEGALAPLESSTRIFTDGKVAAGRFDVWLIELRSSKPPHDCSGYDVYVDPSFGGRVLAVVRLTGGAAAPPPGTSPPTE